MINYENCLSKIVLETPPSGIRRFFDIAASVKDCISLGVGEPDFPTPWYISQAGIQSIQNGHTCYSSNAGNPELRSAINEYYLSRFGVSYDIRQTIVTVGASEAIDMALRAMLNPGDEVLIPEPSYVSYSPCVRFASGTPIAIATDASNGFKLTAEALKNAITPRTKAIIFPYPNNPTGSIMTKQELLSVCAELMDSNIIVISDEIYAELTYGDEKHCAVASLPGMYERTITINGFSKAFSMTGWRLGYVMAPQPITDQMLKIHQLTMICASNISQDAGIVALREGAQQNFIEVRKMRREYNRRRQYLVSTLREMGFGCFEPMGAFYVFPNISKCNLSSEDFCEALLKEQNVATVPGTAFGKSGEGFIRISYAYSMDHLQKAMQRLNSFLKDHST